MRMRVTGDEWDDDPARSDANPDGIPERTITRMRVLEFGPVTFPANPGASAGVRSATDEFYGRLAGVNPPAFADAVRACGLSSSRTSPGGTARGAPPAVSAWTCSQETASRHRPPISGRSCGTAPGA